MVPLSSEQNPRTFNGTYTHLTLIPFCWVCVCALNYTDKKGDTKMDKQTEEFYKQENDRLKELIKKKDKALKDIVAKAIAGTMNGNNE